MFNKFLSRKKENIKKMIQPTFNHWSALKSDFKSRVKKFSYNRTKSESDLAQDNFQLVLNAWGMRSSDIDHVLISLRLRYLLFLLPIIIGIILIFLKYHFSAVFLTITGIVGILTTAWRISILKNQQFVPFLKWILRS